MGFIKIVPPPVEHCCILPPIDVTKYGIGTLYACDDCHRRYEVARDDKEPPWLYWKRVPTRAPVPHDS